MFKCGVILSSSQVAAILGKFLATVKVLNIELIGLGSSGFLELEHSIGKDVKLVYINIRLTFMPEFFVILSIVLGCNAYLLMTSV